MYLGDGEDDSASGLVTDASVGPGSWQFLVVWQHAAAKQSCLQEMIQNEISPFLMGHLLMMATGLIQGVYVRLPSFSSALPPGLILALCLSPLLLSLSFLPSLSVCLVVLSPAYY